MSFSVCFTPFYSCVDRKSSDLGLGGMRREYLQTDCAINLVQSFSQLVCTNYHVALLLCTFARIWVILMNCGCSFE